MNVSTTMRELSIDKDSFRVLGLLPLVYVAWADGSMQRAERSRIRKIASDKGWLTGSAGEILDGWLESAPEAEYAEKGFALLQALADKKRGVGASLTTHSLEELLSLCVDVAEAAGGFLGLGESVSDDETQALGQVAEALGVASADGWRELVESIEESPEAPGPKGHPIVGNAPELMADALGTLVRCYRDHGDVVRLRMPGVKAFLISRPEHIQYMLTDNARNYIRGKSFDPFRPILHESILTTSGEQWKRFRKLAQPAFHHTAIEGMATMMAECARDMGDDWVARAESKEPFDVAAQMHSLTLRVIGHALFGIDLHGEANAEFSESVRIGIENAGDRMNVFRIPDVVPTAKNRRFKKASEFFDNAIRTMVEERRASGELGTDLLGMLLAARDEDTGEGLSDDHVRNEVLTYLVAGHETTATTLTWCFYLLSKHPLAARRLDEELAEVLGGRAPTVDDVPRLPYLSQVIDETMRLYPAAFLTSREAVSEDNIGGYTIPTGAWVMASPYVTHRRPDLWENPEGFDPDRFSAERSEGRHSCAYFPFLAGPHKCIGQPLSLLEMRIVLAVLWQRFRLDLAPGFEPEIEALITLRAKTMEMSAHLRSPHEAVVVES
jgi:cytochrome P450